MRARKGSCGRFWVDEVETLLQQIQVRVRHVRLNRLGECEGCSARRRFECVGWTGGWAGADPGFRYACQSVFATALWFPPTGKVIKRVECLSLLQSPPITNEWQVESASHEAEALAKQSLIPSQSPISRWEAQLQCGAEHGTLLTQLLP